MSLFRRHVVFIVGVVLLCAALLLGIVTYGIDTTVTTGAVWSDGVFQGVTEVRQDGAEETRRDRLLAEGALALLGIALMGLGAWPHRRSAASVDSNAAGDRLS